MSYMIEKFNNGEVHTQDGACGWLMADGEFRPLMSDAMPVSYTHLTLPTILRV